MDEKTLPAHDGWPVPLHTVLQSLAAGEEVVLDLGSAGSLEIRLHTGGRERSAGNAEPLSVRARAVLRLLEEGRPAAVAADVLGLSLGELVGDLTQVRARYDVGSTAAAVRSARAAGDLEQP